MTGLAELITECAANDPDGWANMWRIIEGIALGPVRRLLRQYRFDGDLADDVLQELYLYLQVESARRLRLFRGTTVPQFQAYIRVTATRFGKKMIRRWERTRLREYWAARGASRTAVCGGPTDSQVRLAVAELLRLLPPDDYFKLQSVSAYCQPGANGEAAGAPSARVPSRTARRWRSELLHKYAGLV
ncbi:MAG TPA: hypothetical protein VFE78_07875 [Gemmataceae bacterium]|nr:hypothetical protein [Gemmataceae bacterium]